MTQEPDWSAADKAYQLHHSGCTHCIAAGANPNILQRCAEGQALWDAYNQAGDPPHFTWLARKKDRNGKHQQP